MEIGKLYTSGSQFSSLYQCTTGTCLVSFTEVKQRSRIGVSRERCLHSGTMVSGGGCLGSGISGQAAGRRGSWKRFFKTKVRVLDAIHSFHKLSVHTSKVPGNQRCKNQSLPSRSSGLGGYNSHFSPLIAVY